MEQSQGKWLTPTVAKLEMLPIPSSLEQIKVVNSDFQFNQEPILLARNSLGLYLVLFAISEPMGPSVSEALKLSNGFFIRNRDLVDKQTGKTRNYLELAASSIVDSKLLAAVIEEIVINIQLETEESVIETSRSVIERWKKLLSVEVRRRLSLIELIGLIGELVTLEHFLQSDANFDLSSWTGPQGAVHDFEFHSNSLEVKTTSVPGSRVATISGYAQLELTEGKPLGLLFIEIRLDPDGRRISELCQTLEKKLGQKGIALWQKLALVGIDGLTMDQYSDVGFELLYCSLYEITNTFPKITHSNIVQIDPEKRILDVIYQVDLAHIPCVSGKRIQDTLLDYL